MEPAIITPARSPGDVVNGRLLIQRVLGQGGMGIVYQAYDSLRGHAVAMKYLLWRPNRQAALDGFKQEFATLAQLHHPHICAVYDFAQDPDTGCYYFTSELLQAVDIYHATSGLPAAEIERFARHMLDALDYLHARQIYHFDIKPQNILVTLNANGQLDPATASVKLIDFGLTNAISGTALVGTPSYMAPEMIRRETPDHRADLYSLGVVLYQLFSRTNPFRAANRDDIFRNQHTLTPPPIATRAVGLSAACAALITQLLNKSREDRPASAGEALALLPTPTLTPRAVPTSIPWYDAHQHYATALDCLLSTAADAPCVVWIRGAPGAGKSRLLRELSQRAQLGGYATIPYDQRDLAARMTWMAAIDTAAHTLDSPHVIVIDDADTQCPATLAHDLAPLCARLREHRPSARLVLLVATAADTPRDTLAHNALHLAPHDCCELTLTAWDTAQIAACATRLRITLEANQCATCHADTAGVPGAVIAWLRRAAGESTTPARAPQVALPIADTLAGVLRTGTTLAAAQWEWAQLAARHGRTTDAVLALDTLCRTAAIAEASGAWLELRTLQLRWIRAAGHGAQWIDLARGIQAACDTYELDPSCWPLWCELGRFWRDRGEQLLARSCLQEALHTVSAGVDHAAWQVMIQSELAACHLAEGEAAHAAALCALTQRQRQALTSAQQQALPMDCAGDARCALAQWPEAMAEATAQISAGQRWQQPDRIMQANAVLGRAASQSGDFPRARTAWQACLTLAELLRHTPLAIESLLALAAAPEADDPESLMLIAYLKAQQLPDPYWRAQTAMARALQIHSNQTLNRAYFLHEAVSYARQLPPSPTRHSLLQQYAATLYET